MPKQRPKQDECKKAADEANFKRVDVLSDTHSCHGYDSRDRSNEQIGAEEIRVTV
jgi:hypothetical protein